MVVLAILGLAIGISYATANRSLKSTRAAQENAEGAAVLQSQLETLRYLAPTLAVSPGLTALPDPFCIDPSAANPDATSIRTGAACKGMGNSARYEVGISYDAADKSFELKATWADVITSNAQDPASVTFEYRPYN